MQKVFRFILMGGLLLLAMLSQAQEEASIPPIAFIVGNGLIVYYPETDSVYPVTDASREPYVLFYRAFWSPQGAALAYLSPNPEDERSSILTVDDLQGNTIAVTIADFATPFYLNWLADGRILYATYSGERDEFAAELNAYVIAAEENAEPELLGTFEVLEGCGGGTGHPAESDYYHETSLGGYREVFELTPFGLVHDGQCVGAEVTLTNLETGESQLLAGGGLAKAVVSPDGTQVIGLKDGQLTLVNLADMSVSTIPTTTTPDQYVWADANTVIYSSYADNGDLFAPYTAEEIATIETAIGYDVELMPRRAVSIYALDLSGASDSLLYTADAFAIGRMAVRDNWLIFSQIENAERWMQGMVDGTITRDNNFAASQDTVYTQVFALNRGSLEATLLLNDAQQMVVAP